MKCVFYETCYSWNAPSNSIFFYYEMSINDFLFPNIRWHIYELSRFWHDHSCNEFPFLWNVPAIYPIKSFIFLHIKCQWNFLFIKFPLSEMSFMRNILSIKFPIFEMSYLWNVLPKNCPIYELSCLWNVLSIKYPFYEMSQHLRKCILIKFLLTVLSLIN